MILTDYFNAMEVALWGVIGVGLLIVSCRQGRMRRESAMAGLLFLAFAASDAVELQTGAWWRPWWLLIWKAGCIVGLLMVARRAIRRRN